MAPPMYNYPFQNQVQQLPQFVQPDSTLSPPSSPALSPSPLFFAQACRARAARAPRGPHSHACNGWAASRACNGWVSRACASWTVSRACASWTVLRACDGRVLRACDCVRWLGLACVRQLGPILMHATAGVPPHSQGSLPWTTWKRAPIALATLDHTNARAHRACRVRYSGPHERPASIVLARFATLSRSTDRIHFVCRARLASIIARPFSCFDDRAALLLSCDILRAPTSTSLSHSITRRRFVCGPPLCLVPSTEDASSAALASLPAQEHSACTASTTDCAHARTGFIASPDATAPSPRRVSRAQTPPPRFVFRSSAPSYGERVGRVSRSAFF
ncbi:hypothetical protein DFH11DRAFT_1733798 [Phellopilus nigrolimitatus]|nr:hypothetical protein DFH11DRAFT_1733798 [Phellopilus nigrolimitatus]